jgi:hypothetical protein
MVASGLWLVLGVIILASIAVMVANYTNGAVSRARLEMFARRQRLTVTVDNGDRVIRYLATTRRWRVAGFIGGLLASQLGTPEGTIIHFNSAALFAGWFLGALVAEVRVEHLGHGSIRAASLRPRRPHRYVRRFVWLLVPASAVVALVTGAATAAAGATGRVEPDWTLAGIWLTLAIALAVTVRLIQLAVLRRPQPAAAPDVIEADDAIRSRSLHVLSGGGAALVLFLTLNVLSVLHPTRPEAAGVIAMVQVFAVFAMALLGWLVATSMWPPPGTRRAGRPAIGTA